VGLLLAGITRSAKWSRRVHQRTDSSRGKLSAPDIWDATRLRYAPVWRVERVPPEVDF